MYKIKKILAMQDRSTTGTATLSATLSPLAPFPSPSTPPPAWVQQRTPPNNEVPPLLFDNDVLNRPVDTMTYQNS